jgi:hypothetical protein
MKRRRPKSLLVVVAAAGAPSEGAISQAGYSPGADASGICGCERASVRNKGDRHENTRHFAR